MARVASFEWIHTGIPRLSRLSLEDFSVIVTDERHSQLRGDGIFNPLSLSGLLGYRQMSQGLT